jgi:hypothetical protein
MIEIHIEQGQVIIQAPKCLLVLTKAEFIAALKRGKAFRRREAQAAREGASMAEPEMTQRLLHAAQGLAARIATGKASQPAEVLRQAIEARQQTAHAPWGMILYPLTLKADTPALDAWLAAQPRCTCLDPTCAGSPTGVAIVLPEKDETP